MRKAYVKKPFKKYRKYPKKSLKKLVRKEIERDVEHKAVVFDLTGSLPSIGNVWNELVLANPAQGLTLSNRIGRKISIKTLEINGVLAGGQSESALDDAYNVLRVRIALYTGETVTPCTGVSLNSPIRKDITPTGKYLIKTYMDKYIPLNVASTEKGGGDGYAPMCKRFKYFKKFSKPIEMDYVSDLVVPNKFLIMSCISNSAAVPSPGFVSGWIVIRYTDE